ncbi:hypothetical protein SY83_13870 [Paenibacillus swuensis]|uniref:Asp/Glu/hydantoin racemase n=1 Tax=Paenibacillus swuensis TaxID=1178515 RepID=A0A172TK75_9BACL|nr:hypothetical protein [Paenibacillus swuensis]ANE47173.1 hypothetical protein SY83_13870 [Paenibacillus swuensis]
MQKKKIGCLHAHHSNISYIEDALGGGTIEFVHFVDPGLMNRMKADPDFNLRKAQEKVHEQIEWIIHTNVDAVFITCTNYIALLDEKRLSASVPIMKMDEPFFRDLTDQNEPQILLFTNPATVEGTMQRLQHYVNAHHKSPQLFEAKVIDNTFDLIMQGKQQEYVDTLTDYMQTLLLTEPRRRLSVAQLSMVQAALNVERTLGISVGNPLKSLVRYFENEFSDKKKRAEAPLIDSHI